MNRRRIEVAVLVFGVGFSAIVVLSVKRGMRPSASASSTQSPLPAGSEEGHPTTVLSGFDYTETVKGKPAFRIRSERNRVARSPGSFRPLCPREACLALSRLRTASP
jgi:hypothetical protein